MNNEQLTPLEEEDEYDPTVVLTNENGDEDVFTFLELIDYEDESYAVMLPEGSETDVVIFHLDESDEEIDTFEGVSDPDIAQAVFELFVEHMKALEEDA